MADTWDWGSLAGLLGGLIQSAGGVAASAEASKENRDALAAQKALFNQYRTQMSPDVIASGISRTAQDLSPALVNSIIRDITSRFSASGAQGAGGMLMQAIAEALAQARLGLLAQAQSAYFRGQEMPTAALPRTQPVPSIGNPFDAVVKYFLNKKPAVQLAAGPGTESSSTSGTPVLGGASFFDTTPPDTAAPATG